MMKIQVVSYNQVMPGKLMLGVFGETGGTIGRGEGNVLVLPDENRHISRVHASISCQAGQYRIVDQGSATPVCVNGKNLGKGNGTLLNDGDEIRIGPYVLAARMDKDDTPTDVFVPKREASPAIPDDFDPFSDVAGGGHKTVEIPVVTPAMAASAKSAAALVQDMPALGPKSQEPSIDQLFGLQPGSQQDPLGLNYGGANGKQELIPELDPLQVLNGVVAHAPGPARPMQRDDTPELQRAFVPPAVTVAESHKETQKIPVQDDDAEPSWPFEPLQPKVVAQETDPVAASASANDGLLLSWEENAASQHDALVQSVNVDPPIEKYATTLIDPISDEKTATTQGFDVVLDLEDTRPLSVAPEAAMARPALSPALNQQLLQAFLSGAGVDDLEIRDGLTPEFMQHLGQLLRETMQGTIDLLLARALVKNEFRADMTMISAQNNNPLKFSPNVEVALAQLLKPQTRGFMPPLHAVKDAYNDLRSHQFGVMTGMQAALEGVLHQLDPAQLEQRLKQKNMLDSVLPMNRKAKLWDLFVEHYQDIVQEAEEDFHSLFGKAFVRAYQAQLDNLGKNQANKK